MDLGVGGCLVTYEFSRFPLYDGATASEPPIYQEGATHGVLRTHGGLSLASGVMNVEITAAYVGHCILHHIGRIS